MARRIIYWFRNDLRLFDNEALRSAIDAGDEIIPVYVFDPRQFETTKLGFRRTGTLRTRFLMEAVEDLRRNIREKGGDLMIRVGEPEKIVSQLAEQYQASHVYASKEIAPQETRIESSLSKNLKVGNVDIELYWMDTLVPAEKLPFTIARLPVCFDDFYQLSKNQVSGRKLFEEPATFNIPADFEAGEMPSFSELGVSDADLANAQASSRGGELTGQALLKSVREDILLGRYHHESPELLIDTHLSDWLSVGCLSAATIYDELGTLDTSSSATAMLIRNLLARDYFNWILLRYGPRLFKPSGVTHTFEKQWSNDRETFEKWIQGQTPDEEINHLVTQLNRTGHITLPEREKLAAYLADTLQVNWTWGAMYYESCLIDYKVAVNWGRWNNISGVGKC
ncbi:deoxyribodipyrimidine photo-lyase [Dyadobacter sandarakinus]|uniref:Deoxyribodipyrimidine photo-lyase n=1 Tax=Dyadobacter sandarakinus TaxID=2747268 RepID=A0ABX7I917_9BACT|nr:deoxyribodipyrimidine photo-lyase [Dyadobacter sandarakinus]QRR02318.1 deoxyribodipyrimidine photo-lyase [Dyadobacter sandarakinus]